MAVPRTKTRRKTSPTARPVLTPRNSCSARAITTGRRCRWSTKLSPASAKAVSANAFTAEKKSMPSAWKPFRGRGTASNARKSWSRDCWKRLRGREIPREKRRRKNSAAFVFSSGPYRALRLLRVRSLGSRHQVLEPGFALLLEFRMRQRLAREHLVAHGRVVDEDGLDHRRLCQIFRLQSFVRVHIRVVRTRAVIQRILNELEPRDAHRVERFMIRAACISYRDCAHAEIAQRRHPLLEDGTDGGILLQVDTANFSRAVIQIEISRNFLLLRFQLNWTDRLAHEVRQVQLVGRSRKRYESEMLLYVSV